MREILFTKLEFKNHDLYVPFVCHGCGTCCRTYTPFITADNLVVIARDLRLPEAGLLEDHEYCYRRCLVGRPVPCCFLSAESRCIIYRHPLRPDVCRLYPFSFGRPAIYNCPAHDEHDRIVAGFLAGGEDPDLYDSSFCPDRSCRPPPPALWPRLQLLLRDSEPPRLVIRRFLQMNRLPKQFLHRAKRRRLTRDNAARLSL
jgi:Fe-S-cluster containining protein